MPDSDFLIANILRRNEVHLISGPSGSGKTTLLLQVLADWRDGSSVFTHAAQPVPYALVACDRPATALRDTMLRLGIAPDTVPHFSAVDLRRERFQAAPADDPGQFSLSEIIALCRKRVPDCAAVFVDGLPALCRGKIIDHGDVRTFLQDAARLCQTQKVTILGTVYAAKARDGEGYSSPRDRMLGSGAWSAFTSTKIIIEPDEAKRTVHILPQNFPPQLIELMHDPDTGRLVPYVATGISDRLDTWLKSMEPGSLFTTQQAVMVGEMCGVSKSTVERWIRNQLTLGTIIKIDRGEYRVTGKISEN